MATSTSRDQGAAATGQVRHSRSGLPRGSSFAAGLAVALALVMVAQPPALAMKSAGDGGSAQSGRSPRSRLIKKLVVGAVITGMLAYGAHQGFVNAKSRLVKQRATQIARVIEGKLADSKVRLQRESQQTGPNAWLPVWNVQLQSGGQSKGFAWIPIRPKVHVRNALPKWMSKLLGGKSDVVHFDYQPADGASPQHTAAILSQMNTALSGKRGTTSGGAEYHVVPHGQTPANSSWEVRTPPPKR